MASLSNLAKFPNFILALPLLLASCQSISSTRPGGVTSTNSSSYTAVLPCLGLKLTVGNLGSDGRVPITLTAKNICNQSAMVYFGNQPAFDIIIYQGDSEIWNFNNGRPPTNILQVSNLMAGEEVNFVASWDLKNNNGSYVATGSYRIKGVLTATGLQSDIDSLKRRETPWQNLLISP
ncbi:BsuPI-related putative proteinase inhibitor [Deinococcus planocerae]|uniref:BsuPI-related putative proteinase inhibitor n=1 Tax=Deinococcus planocerae TaxID=1737569 RepID=UPI0011AF44D1